MTLILPTGRFQAKKAAGGGGGGSGFVLPDDLFDGTTSSSSGSEVGAWLDFGDTSSLFQSNAGSTAVTTASDPIGYVTDKSGSGNHFNSTADTAVRPTYVSGGGALFSAANSTGLKGVGSAYGTMGAAMLSMTGFYCAIVVGIPSSRPTAAGRYISSASAFANADFTSSNDIIFANYNGSTTYKLSSFSNPSNTNTVETAVSANTNYLFETTYDQTTMDCYLDTSDEGGFAKTNTPSAVQMAIGMQVGNFAVGGVHLTGTIFEIILINRMVDTDELADVRAYLKDRWSLTGY